MRSNFGNLGRFILDGGNVIKTKFLCPGKVITFHFLEASLQKSGRENLTFSSVRMIMSGKLIHLI